MPFPSPMSESEVIESCPTVSDPMDCSLPGSSVHGIFQARVLEWAVISFSSVFLRYLFNETFLSLLSILWNSSFGWVRLSLSPLPFISVIPQLFVKPPQKTALLLAFLFLADVSVIAF